MADLGSQLNQLTPEQRQAIMVKVSTNERVAVARCRFDTYIRFLTPLLLLPQAQQEANQQVMQEMMKNMVSSCFEKCAGTSVRIVSSTRHVVRPGVVVVLSSHSHSLLFPQGDKLDSREQACLASCQDRYLETRTHVQEALQKRQGEFS